jgi:hypothetical protein
MAAEHVGGAMEYFVSESDDRAGAPRFIRQC